MIVRFFQSFPYSDALVFIRSALRQILSIIAQNKGWGNEGEH